MLGSPAWRIQYHLIICDFEVGTEYCNITGLQNRESNNTDDVGYMDV
jgi:hypothetical protein